MNKRLRGVVIDIMIHFCVGFIGWGLIYLGFNNMLYSLFFLIGAIFIDIDHFIDYFLYYGLSFNPIKFFKLEYLASEKAYVFFHSWELFAIMFSLSIIFNLNYLFFFSLGVAIHLSCDSLYRVKPLFYCLIYRAYHNFNARKICPECLGDII